MSQHVVALNGSPRKRGNTELLIDSALAGAREAGATVETFRLNDLDFRPCQNCGYCETKGVCVLKDDMAAVYKALDEASRFILASPVYFATVSAQAKAMMDRCQPLWARKYLLKQPHANAGRKGIMLSVGGFPHRGFWACTEKAAKTWFTVMDIKYLGGLFYESVDERGAVEKHPTAMQEAFDAGRRLVLGEKIDPNSEGAK
jgi:multimeric flavodoxin WrbA